MVESSLELAVNNVSKYKYPLNLYMFLFQRRYPGIEEKQVKEVMNNVNLSGDALLSVVTSGILCNRKITDFMTDVFRDGCFVKHSKVKRRLSFKEIERGIDIMSSNMCHILSLQYNKTNVSGIGPETDIIVLGLDRTTNLYLRNGGINKIGDIIKNLDKLYEIDGIGAERIKKIRYNPKLTALYNDIILGYMKTGKNKYVN